MFAPMTIHVDQLHGLLRTSEGCLGDAGAISDEGDDGPVLVRIHLLIEDSDVDDGADGLRDRIDDILAAALREAGDALADLRPAAGRGDERPGSLKPFSDVFDRASRGNIK